ncbi:hypothetical protein C6370_10485 [Bacillus atrophaeus]|uniref:hypothetical protein n=1 Tax=Bacillus atrophaeus TaxID=1452 RepID=UPI000D04D74B|nr:hypothetical protein [Bacillus atrophaeus]PSA95396.1 hypothetical protein C6370_10485 [Bacillus atrophaeus]
MFLIDPKDYPKHREWNAKVFSLPKIPRSDMGQPVVLREILKAIVNKVPYGTKMKFTGSTSEATLENLCRWLRPIGLIHKEGGIWKISEESKRYLESEDDFYLTALFCANVRFIGELLVKLDKPLTTMELLNTANKDYKLNWDTKSEVGNRLTWLRQLGLVNFNDFKNTYCLTEKGKEFIKNISYVKPEEIEIIGDPTTKETDIPVSFWAEELIQKSQEQLKSRKPSIGYITGNISEVCNTFNGYIQLMYSTVDKESFLNYSKETFNISVSSANSFVTTLTNIDFLERKSRNLYEATEIAKKWLTTKSALDLVFCLHAKVLFIFEMLKELEKESLSVKELAVIAKVSYGFETERIEEIRKRLNIMQCALLVQEESPGKYCLTQRAKNILKKVLIQQKIDIEIKSEIENNQSENNYSVVNEYLTELRLASKDSSNPARFEKAITGAFSTLGFNATWLGGAGKTDVLIHSPSIPKYSYTVTVDAKSTQSGVVSEGQINFDTLKEHKKLHSADYIAVVGYSFQGERLVKRAIEHKVVLIDIDSLEKLIRSHSQIPLQANAYKDIFSQAGKVDISCLEVERREIKRSGKLLQSVMECLVAESNDPVTEGLLQEKDIYRTLRNDNRFDTPPSLEEIAEMLQFLSSPLIGCVDRSKEGYYALGTVYDAMNKFNFYAKSCSVE